MNAYFSIFPTVTEKVFLVVIMGNAALEIPEASATRVLVKEGALIKRSVRKKGNNWKKRYYRLYDDGSLDTHLSESVKKVRRRLLLTPKTQVLIVWDHAVTRGEGFVWTIKEGDFEVCFRCLKETKRTEWIETCQRIISKLPAGSEKEVDAGGGGGAAAAADRRENENGKQVES